MISCLSRYWPEAIQLGMVNEALPLFWMSLSTAQVLVAGSKPSSWILNHFRPVTVLCVASGTFAL